MKIKLTENQLRRIIKEMRFDGKSTGLFSSEEPIGEGKKKKRKIPKKYLTKNKSAMRKEINKYAGKDTYKTKWDADYKSGKGGEGKRYKTKKSASTKAYEKMFGESHSIVESKTSDKALKNKSKDSGISFSILKQVYNRGMAAWNSGHRPGPPQNAWAMGTVNSFITGSGGARKADEDLWKKAKKAKKSKNESTQLEEAEYKGRKVKLNKPMAGDVKKFKEYVKNDKDNVVKVNFGQKGVRIKKNDPDKRRSFRARHNCDNPGPKWKARYWSCKKW